MSKKFKLQSVLNYRQSLEELAQQVLGASLQRKGELDAELQNQQTALRKHDEELKRRQQEGLSVAEIELFETQIHHCRRRIEQLLLELASLEQQIAREREELLGAVQDKQVMEKLKEKQEAAYNRELNRQERIILDEVSLRNKGDLP
jgi:flagellar FliJ protein